MSGNLLDLLEGIEERERAASNRTNRWPAALAAKWIGATVYAEPPQTLEPTDANFAEMFQGCARVPRADWYPEIRAAITRAESEA